MSGEEGLQRDGLPAGQHAQGARVRGASGLPPRLRRGGADGGDVRRLVEQVWLPIDGLYLQATYRDRTDGRLGRSAEAALGLARRLVDRSGPV